MNESCLEVIDNALFVVCLDDAHPDNLAELCNNFLCGTYELKNGIQVGTCTNRWYDKVWNGCSGSGGSLMLFTPSFK